MRRVKVSCKGLSLVLLAAALAGMAPRTGEAAAVATDPAANGVLLVGGTLDGPDGSHHGLITVAKGGIAPRPATATGAQAPAADYAPDGRSFAVLRSVSTGGSTGAGELLVHDAGTNAVVKRISLPDRFTSIDSPRFSPDGRRVALTAAELPGAGQSQACGALLMVRVATGAVSVLRGGQADCGSFVASDIDWSGATAGAADGRFVWTGSNAQGDPTLEIWRPGAPTLVVHDVTVGSGLRPDQPRWSPDGSRIAMVMGGQAGGHLYVADATTGELRRLVGPAPHLFDPSAPLVWDPVFAPDGDSVAFLWRDADNPSNADVRAVRIDVSRPIGGGAAEVLVRPGGGLRPLTSLRDWQPLPGAVAGAPTGLAGLTAVPDDRRNRLSWTSPTVADFYAVVVYRSTSGFTDVPRASSTQQLIHAGHEPAYLDFGAYPPGYGPGAWSDTLVHNRDRRPLVNGQTYFYSAFVVDATGLVSPAAKTTGTPEVLAAAAAPVPAGRIRYVRNTGSGPATAEVWSMKPDGTDQRRIRRATNEVLSPDGTMVAYVTGTGLWRAQRDGSDPVRLAVHGAGGHRAQILYPTWAPDSSRIAFVRSFEAPVCGGAYCFEDSLYIVAAVGGSQARVLGTGAPPTSDSTRRSFGDLEWGPALAGYPDGRLAFTETYHCPNASLTTYINCFGSLMIVNPDGSEQVYVGNYGYTPTTFEVFEFAPAWSPDGRFLAFEHSDQQGSQYDGGVRIVNVDGSGERVLVDHPDWDETAPSWTADGLRVVYVRSGDTGASDLWRIRLNRTEARNLTRTPVAAESAPQATAFADIR